MKSIDWTLLQSFVAVGEHGSLSAAARATGGSQPTLSRHINMLERELGVRLFERAVSGAQLTQAGVDMLQHAQQMADAAGRLSLAAEGKMQTMAGTVRITASEVVAAHILPEMLTAFHLEEPNIAIELMASDETENLVRREADIAVRMYRPTQPDVFTRKVAEVDLGVFANPAYLDRRGRPEKMEDILEHDIIGYDQNRLIIDGFKTFGLEVERDFFTFRCDNHLVCWRMVIAGFGLGFNQVEIGEAEPQVERIEAAGIVGTLPVWLTAHAELKTSPRVRRVFDFLAERLSRHGQ